MSQREQVPAHLLGYMKDPRWLDMSNYLVHFTKTANDLGAILTQGLVRADRPHGWGRDFQEVADDTHRSACLSEIPLDQLDRLRARHGRYGIGFRRDFIKNAGGARVW